MGEVGTSVSLPKVVQQLEGLAKTQGACPNLPAGLMIWWRALFCCTTRLWLGYKHLSWLVIYTLGEAGGDVGGVEGGIGGQPQLGAGEGLGVESRVLCDARLTKTLKKVKC